MSFCPNYNRYTDKDKREKIFRHVRFKSNYFHVFAEELSNAQASENQHQRNELDASPCQELWALPVPQPNIQDSHQKY
jgi:hypothetical protein